MSKWQNTTQPTKLAARSNFVDRLGHGADEAKGLLEAILGRPVHATELLPKTHMPSTGNYSYTKSVRFSFNVEDQDSQLNRAVQEVREGKPTKPALLSRSKLSSKNQLSDKGSEIEGFGREALKTRLRNLIENDQDDMRVQDLGNRSLRNVQVKPFVDQNGQMSFKIIDMHHKTFLRSQTDNKVRAAEDPQPPLEAPSSLKKVKRRRFGRERRLSDQFKPLKAAPDPHNLGLESYLDKHAFSDNESDTERLTPVIMMKKKESPKAAVHPIKHQSSIASRQNAHSEVSTNCGNGKSSGSEPPPAKAPAIVLPAPAETRPVYLDKGYPAGESLGRPKTDATLERQNFTIVEEPSYAEDAISPSFSKKVDDRLEDDATDSRKDQIRPCLKKNGKYSLLEKIVQKSEQRARVIDLQPCPANQTPNGSGTVSPLVPPLEPPRPAAGPRTPAPDSAQIDGGQRSQAGGLARDAPVDATRPNSLGPSSLEVSSGSTKTPSDKKPVSQSRCCILI